MDVILAIKNNDRLKFVPPTLQDIKICLMELIGTIALTITVVMSNAVQASPVLTGFMIMALVYCAAPLTLGHFNPCVTAAVWFRGKLSLSSAAYIIVTQHIGGLAGAAAAQYWLGPSRFADNIPVPTISDGSAFVGEMMYATLLILVYLHTTTTHACRGNQYYGLAIGFAQLAGRLVLLVPTGGSFNPAVAAGLYAANSTGKNLWMYYFGPFVGAGIACLFFVIMAPEEYFKHEEVFKKRTPWALKVVLIDWHCAKYFTEFVGTWILTQTAILGNAGFTLMAIVYMGGYISGGMFNPALSIGVWARGLMTGLECFLYCVSQFLGSLVGGGIARVVIGNFLQCGYSVAGKAWLAEWMWTLLLVLVVLSTASSKREPNMFYGLAIGAIVLTGDSFFGPWSNGMFNPAVGLGTCAVDLAEGNNTDGLWIYLTACTYGGLWGAYLDKFLFDNSTSTVLAPVSESQATPQPEPLPAAAPVPEADSKAAPSDHVDVPL